MAKKTVILSGLEDVMNNLRNEAKKIKSGSFKGLILSAIEIRRDMEQNEPKIPIDTGNLRASFFTVTSRGTGKKKPGSFKGPKAGELTSHHESVVSQAQSETKKGSEPNLILGFSAAYGVWVHENMEVKFKRPGAGPKFLESAIRRNQQKVLQIIKDNVKID